MNAGLMIVAWFALGIGAALVLGKALGDQALEVAAVVAAPISAPVALIILLYWATRYVVQTPRRREARTESDYRETLALIDWKPVPRTQLDDVLDALETERPE